MGTSRAGWVIVFLFMSGMFLMVLMSFSAYDQLNQKRLASSVMPIYLLTGEQKQPKWFSQDANTVWGFEDKGVFYVWRHSITRDAEKEQACTAKASGVHFRISQGWSPIAKVDSWQEYRIVMISLFVQKDDLNRYQAFLNQAFYPNTPEQKSVCKVPRI